MKRDPEGYLNEFQLQYNHYKAARDVFLLQPGKKANKDFSDLIHFVAQVCHCYPNKCDEFPGDLVSLLENNMTALDSSLRRYIHTHAFTKLPILLAG